MVMDVRTYDIGHGPRLDEYLRIYEEKIKDRVGKIKTDSESRTGRTKPSVKLFKFPGLRNTSAG